jgi:hypothetical protein
MDISFHRDTNSTGNYYPRGCGKEKYFLGAATDRTFPHEGYEGEVNVTLYHNKTRILIRHVA